MDYLPDEIIRNVILYLPIPSIFLSLSLVTKKYNELSHDKYSLAQIFSILINTKVPISLNPSSLLQLIKKVHTQDHLQRLDFSGFGTTGGIDNESLVYWVGNLFAYNAAPYCSNLGKNVICVGILASDFQANTLLDSCKKKIVYLLESLELLKNRVFPRWKKQDELLAEEEQLFIELYEQDPGQLFLGELRQEEIKRLYDVIKKNRQGFEKVLGDMGRNIMVQEMLHRKFDEIDRIAYIREVEVNRDGSFSCPVRTFLLLVSDVYIDISSDSFNIYNNINSFQALKAFIKTYPQFASKDSFVSGRLLDYYVFGRTYGQLRPVVWGQFRDNQKLEASFRLDDPVSGRYFYALLIDGFNLMGNYQDDGIEPNIDITYVGARGFEIVTKII